MATYERDGAKIHYELHSNSTDAPAVLLIAPGGMKSAISFWSSTPWNPIEQLVGDFQVVAMDQRNAGQSTAPVSGSDGWETYAQDQLGLMSHLGIEQFHVAGMCIGGPYSLALIAHAPQRVRSATLFQTIGRDNNADAFYAMFDGWAQDIQARDVGSQWQVDNSAWSSFRENMYGGDQTLFTVSDSFLQQCSTPLLVLQGDDLYHPRSSSELVRDLAPNVQYIEQWKEGDAVASAREEFAKFLATHSE